MAEIAIDKKVTNDHTFSYLFGLVKVQHILTEQHIRAQSNSMSGKGEYIHTVQITVAGTQVFSIEAHCGKVATVMVGTNQLVGDMLMSKKRL